MDKIGSSERVAFLWNLSDRSYPLHGQSMADQWPHDGVLQLTPKCKPSAIRQCDFDMKNQI